MKNKIYDIKKKKNILNVIIEILKLDELFLYINP